MADIRVTCEKCGRTISVSEYVDEDNLICTCGEPLHPVRLSAPRPRPSVVLRQEQSVERPVAIPPETDDVKIRKKKRRRKKKRKKSILFRVSRFEVNEYWLSWIIFLILAPLFGYLRFSGNVLTKEHQLEDFVYYGLWAYGLIYAIVIVEALRDEMFEGILCLFVPPYAFYYLFFRSDSFALRALISAFTVGFGIDMASVIFEWSSAALRWGQVRLNPHTETW